MLTRQPSLFSQYPFSFLFLSPTSSHPSPPSCWLSAPVCLLAPSFSPARHSFPPQSLLLSPFLPTPLFDFSGPQLSLASSLCFLSIRLVSPTVAFLNLSLFLILPCLARSCLFCTPPFDVILFIGQNKQSIFLSTVRNCPGARAE